MFSLCLVSSERSFYPIPVHVTHFSLFFLSQQKPFIINDGVDEKNRTKFKGYCIDLLEEIRNIINFDYEIYEAPDKQFGNMDESGKWNGMIKELVWRVRHTE